MTVREKSRPFHPFCLILATAGIAVVTLSGGSAAAEANLGADSGQVTAPKARPDDPAAPDAACPVKDPEDGKCYLSADAADAAWIARGKASTPAKTSSSTSRRVLTPLRDEELPLEPDPDADEAEEKVVAVSSATGPATARATAQDILKSQAPSKWSLWQRFVGSMKSFVVRKADGLPVSVGEKELEALFSAGFPLPVENFSVAKFRDSFLSPRGRHAKHHSIDLPAPHGTPVVAIVDGYVERLGRDPRGGKVCYVRDNSGKFLFFYAHLAAYEPSIRVGDRVKKGQHLGYVGSTGRVIGGPHLHFAIFAVEGESNFKKGLAINPYVIFAPLLLR